MAANERTVIPLHTPSNAPPTERLLTYPEVAQMLRVKVNTLYTWVRRGQIPAVRIGPRTVRFRLSDMQAILGGQGGMHRTTDPTPR